MELGIWTNDIDTVFAHNEDEARGAVIEQSGCDLEETDGYGWREMATDETLKIFRLDLDQIETELPDGTKKREWPSETKTVAQWLIEHIEANGDTPAFLCSTEY